MDLGNIIFSLRKEHSLTQEAFANALNKKYGLKLNKAMISKWENNIDTPSLNYVKYMAIFFNVSLDYMLGTFPSSSMSALPEQEATLLLAFRKLNSDGKSKVVEYTKDLSKIEKYQDSSPIKESLEYPLSGAGPALAAEAGSEYSSDLEAQLRKDADEIVKEEYEKFAKAGSVME